MLQKPLLRTAIPGPKSTELRKKEDLLSAPGLQRFALMAGICVESASGSLIRDVDGNEFLDIIGGIGVNGLGHSHPKWVQALQQQLNKISVGSFTSEPRLKLLERIRAHAPAPGIDSVQLYSSGAEAVESALRLAKCATGKHEIVSFWGGFHGKTLGALSLMGSTSKQGYGPLAPGHWTIPYANCYRCPLKLKPSSCGAACVELGRQQLKNQSSGAIAAFIIEPMQGTAGNIIPPKEFLPAVKSLAKEYNALLIADEMITGFGRTGHFWGIDHSGVEPDIVTLGKQFGGGFPISAVLTRKDIALAKPWSEPSGSSSSYGGNPLASTAALAAIEIIEEENLVESSRAVGEVLYGALKDFEERFSWVGEVRGLGLFLGIELVEDKESKIPLRKETCYALFYECLKRGLLTMSYASQFRIQPAMTMNKETALEVAKIMRSAFEAISK